MPHGKMMDVMDLALSLMEWTAGMSSHRVSYAYESSKWPSLGLHFREHGAVTYSVGPRAQDFARLLTTIDYDPWHYSIGMLPGISCFLCYQYEIHVVTVRL